MGMTKTTTYQNLITRYEATLTDLGYSITANEASYLDDPVSFGLRQSGYTVTTFGSVVDADLSQVVVADYDQVLDIAEWRLLLNISGNAPEVDVKIGHRQEEFSQLANRLIQLADRRRTYIRESYGIGLSQISAGFLDLDYITTSDDTNVGI